MLRKKETASIFLCFFYLLRKGGNCTVEIVRLSRYFCIKVYRLFRQQCSRVFLNEKSLLRSIIIEFHVFHVGKNVRDLFFSINKLHSIISF